MFVGTALAYFITGQPLDWSLPVFKDTGAMLGEVSSQDRGWF